MPNLRLAPKAIAQEPEESGARTITVGFPGGDDVDVAFSEAEAVQLVRMFQKGFLDRMEKRQIHPHYPSMTLLDVNIAHGREGSGLLLETAEIGSMVVTYAPTLSGKIRHELDRVDASNAARLIGN